MPKHRLCCRSGHRSAGILTRLIDVVVVGGSSAVGRGRRRTSPHLSDSRHSAPERFGLRSGVPSRLHGWAPGLHVVEDGGASEDACHFGRRGWNGHSPSCLQRPSLRSWRASSCVRLRCGRVGRNRSFTCALVRPSIPASRFRADPRGVGLAFRVSGGRMTDPVRRPVASLPSVCARGCWGAGRRPGGTFNPG